MEMRNFTLGKSSGGGPFPLVCKYSAVLNNISSCSSSSMSLLIYVATYFVGEEGRVTPMWQVLCIGITPEKNWSFLMAPTSYFSSTCQLPSLPYNMTVPLEYYCRVRVSIGNDCTHIACEYVYNFVQYFLEYACTLCAMQWPRVSTEMVFYRYLYKSMKHVLSLIQFFPKTMMIVTTDIYSVYKSIGY